MDQARGLFGNDLEATSRLLSQELGGFDKGWNMLSLSPQVHDWWGRGLLAFRCLGITPGEPTTVHLEVRWTVKRTSKASKKPIDMDVESELQRIAIYSRLPEQQTDSNEGIGIVSVAKPMSRRRVLSGDIIKIQLLFEDAKKMRQMVDLQWAMVKILTLAGAAGSPELQDEPDHPPSTESEIQQWIESVESQETPSEIRGGPGATPASPLFGVTTPPQLFSPYHYGLGRGQRSSIPTRPQRGRSRGASPEKRTSPARSEPQSEPGFEQKLQTTESVASPTRTTLTASPERKTENLPPRDSQ